MCVCVCYNLYRAYNIDKYLKRSYRNSNNSTYGRYIKAHYFRYSDLDRMLIIIKNESIEN